MNSEPAVPPSRPHRIMTSTARAQTEPVPGGFMQSMVGYHNIDDMGDGMIVVNGPEKKLTQEEQDAADDKARKRAMRNLVNSWQERLQLISVITTFFASTEAAMLVNTKPVTADDLANEVLKASNACLLGSLIVHVYAAVLSFLGAFLLIRYKLKEATRDEMIAEGIRLVNSPVPIKDVERDVTDRPQQQTLRSKNAGSTMSKSAIYNTVTSGPDQNKNKSSYLVEPPIISRNPHIEQVGLFVPNVSSHLLSRTHALCVFLAATGFVLAIAGILSYAWAVQRIAVSIFTSVCLGFAVLATIVVLFV